MTIFNTLHSAGVSRLIALADPPSGLRAFVVLDDLTLGPAAGGIRTQRYSSDESAIADAARLASAMTLKCAIAGLDAGGGKTVVIDHDGLNRPKAFERLGEEVEALGGLLRTAGDLGTRAADLEALARRTQYVHLDEPGLTLAVVNGLLSCIEACIAVRGVDGPRGLRIAVQGCGLVGGAVARGLHAAGARLVLADIDPSRARALAAEIGAEVCDAEQVLGADVDIVAPCAVGGVLTADVARELQAWAVCGAANNILADPSVAELLRKRGIIHVPDIIASAGAVVEGIGASVMKLPERSALVKQLGITAREVLKEAQRMRKSPSEVAEARARQRIAAARQA